MRIERRLRASPWNLVSFSAVREAAMDEMRAMLDCLMGRDRNEYGKNKKGDYSFKDDEVCKFFLLDYCPHELFPNTRSDLGPCPKEHRPDLKEAFEKDENHEYYKAMYEQEFMKFLKRLVDQMESRIKKVQQRIDANNTATELDKDTAEKVNAVNAKISELLKKQDEAGAKGEIDVAEKLNEEVALLQREVQRLKNPHADIATIRESQLRVCAVCGALQSAGDALCRYESHASGKQHRGFEKIRSSLAKLVETEREREAVLSRGLPGSRRGASSGNVNSTERSRGDERRRGESYRGRSPLSRDRGAFQEDASRHGEHFYRGRGRDEEDERRRREPLGTGERGSRYYDGHSRPFASAYGRDGRSAYSRRGGDEHSRGRYGERDRELDREGRFRGRDYPSDGRRRGYGDSRGRDDRRSWDRRDREDEARRGSERSRESYRRYRDDGDERRDRDAERSRESHRRYRGGDEREDERGERGERGERDERERQRSRHSRQSRSGERHEEEGEVGGERDRETKRRRYEEKEREARERRESEYASHCHGKPKDDSRKEESGREDLPSRRLSPEESREEDKRGRRDETPEKEEKNGYGKTEAHAAVDAA